MLKILWDGDSTNVAPLSADLISHGKPKYTEVA